MCYKIDINDNKTNTKIYKISENDADLKRLNIVAFFSRWFWCGLMHIIIEGGIPCIIIALAS